MRKVVGYRFDYERWSSDMYNARRGRGVTQQTLGQVIGKTKATISRYESLKTFPEVVDFLAICFYFDWNPMEYLLVGDDVKKTAYMFDELRQLQQPRTAQSSPLS